MLGHLSTEVGGERRVGRFKMEKEWRNFRKIEAVRVRSCALENASERRKRGSQPSVLLNKAKKGEDIKGVGEGRRKIAR